MSKKKDKKEKKQKKKKEESDVSIDMSSVESDISIDEPKQVEETVAEEAVAEEPVVEEVKAEIPSDRPEGAPKPSECIAEYETKRAFIYKLKNHRKVIIEKVAK